MLHEECQTTGELMVGLLNGSLTSEQIAIAESHLDHCAHCRTKLENESADPAFWKSIGCINDDQYDLDQLTDPDIDPNDLAQDDDRHEHAVLLDSVRGLLAPTEDPNSAGRIGIYEIMGVIGAGGMGIVLKARDPSLDRIVAVKILAPHLASSQNARLRFERETKAAAAVKHHGIIPIYAVDNHGNTPYFVMPFEKGPSLSNRIQSAGPLTVEECLRVAIQMAEALAAAHESGLVHRDIKPSNILLAPGTERALLTDFGLAQVADQQQVTLTGVLAGTPAFMSPEQARGEAVDYRTDLFSLGSVMFMMLTGQPPINDGSSFVVIRQIASGDLPRLRSLRPDVPVWLDELIARLHRVDPRQRIESAEAAAELIKQCQHHHQNPGTEKLPSWLNGKSGRRQKIIQTGIIVAIMATVAVMVTISIFPFPGNRQPDTNPKETQTSSMKSGDGLIDQSWNDGLSPLVGDAQSELEELDDDDHWVFQTEIEDKYRGDKR